MKAERDVTRVLGIDFFHGSAREAVERMRTRGGLLVVPSAPTLKDLERPGAYREALLSADMALTDSAFMVMIWNRLSREPIRRVSGLEYLRELLTHEEVRRPGNTVWVMASERSAERNLVWLKEQGIEVPPECVYLAPIYAGGEIQDEPLVALLAKLRPKHVILTVGGGVQERLGLHLRRRLPFVPAIHCIGAAIAFLSGDQVYIPVWADRLYLGWLFRSISKPQNYVPRYWDARKLLGLMLRYRDQLPPAVPGKAED